MNSVILSCLILVWLPNFLQADKVEQQVLASPAGRVLNDVRRFEDSKIFVELRASPNEWQVSIADVRGAKLVGGDIIIQDESLVLPVGTRIGVTGLASDTLQAFSFPSLSINEDLVPGMERLFTLEPLVLGVHDGTCGNFCGQVQGSPFLTIEVVDDVSFNEWLVEHTK